MSKTQTQVSTIIFDIGNVIVQFDYMIAANEFVRITGLPLETIRKYFYYSELERQYSRGEVSTQDFFAKLKEDLDLKIDFETFARVWNSIFWANEFIVDFIHKVKPKYRLACISNTNELHYDNWLADYSILSEIETFFPSHEVGMRKPDLKIFQHAIESLGIKAEEALFIDDMPENVEAARQAGLKAVVFQDKNVFLEDLKQYGVAL